MYLDRIQAARRAIGGSALGVPGGRVFVNMRDLPLSIASVPQRVLGVVRYMARLRPGVRPEGLIFEDTTGERCGHVEGCSDKATRAGAPQYMRCTATHMRGMPAAACAACHAYVARLRPGVRPDGLMFEPTT